MSFSKDVTCGNFAIDKGIYAPDNGSNGIYR